LARSSVPKTHSIKRNWKSSLKRNPKEIRKGNRKQNELRFQEMVAILSPLGLYGGKPKD
jgi:hypothetical protein